MRKIKPGVERSGNTEIKRGKEWAAAIEIAATLFNWINNPCLKSREGSLGYMKSGPGTPDPGHWTHWHRKDKLLSLNNKQWKEFSAGKTPSRWADGHKCPKGNQVDSQWTYLLIFGFQKEQSKGNQSILVPKEKAGPARNPEGQEGWELGNSAKAQLRYPRQIRRKVTCRTEPMKGLYSFLRARGRINMLSGSSCENWQRLQGMKHKARWWSPESQSETVNHCASREAPSGII